MVLYDPTSAKVGHLHPIYLYILAVVLKSFWFLGLKSTQSISGRGWIWYSQKNNKKYVFHQFEFVDKNNKETQNPRSDNSIPSVSAGLTSGGNKR